MAAVEGERGGEGETESERDCVGVEEMESVEEGEGEALAHCVTLMLRVGDTEAVPVAVAVAGLVGEAVAVALWVALRVPLANSDGVAVAERSEGGQGEAPAAREGEARPLREIVVQALLLGVEQAEGEALGVTASRPVSVTEMVWVSVGEALAVTVAVALREGRALVRLALGV